MVSNLIFFGDTQLSCCQRIDPPFTIWNMQAVVTKR